MQQMYTLIDNLLIFLIVMLIGYIIGSKKMVKPTLKDDLSFLLLKVTLPAMLINAIVKPYNKDLNYQALLSFVLIIVCILVSYLVGYSSMKAFKIEPHKQGVWLLGSTFSNLGFMGFPVINALYGANGLFLASIANIAHGILFYSFGIYLVSRGRGDNKLNWRGVFLNNIMIAIFISLIFYFAQIPLPDFVQGTVASVGVMTTPITLLIIGLKLSEYQLKEVFNNHVQYELSLVRLIVVPVVIVLLLKFIPIKDIGLLIAVLAIANAMPMPGNTTVLANEYGGDEGFAAKSTTLSTVLCLLTIPLIYMLIEL